MLDIASRIWTGGQTKVVRPEIDRQAVSQTLEKNSMHYLLHGIPGPFGRGIGGDFPGVLQAASQTRGIKRQRKGPAEGFAGGRSRLDGLSLTLESCAGRDDLNLSKSGTAKLTTSPLRCELYGGSYLIDVLGSRCDGLDLVRTDVGARSESLTFLGTRVGIPFHL